MGSQNWVTAVTDSEAPHLPRTLCTNGNTGTYKVQTFKDVNMHPHVQSHEPVLASGVHARVRASSTNGCASVQSTGAQSTEYRVLYRVQEYTISISGPGCLEPSVKQL